MKDWTRAIAIAAWTAFWISLALLTLPLTWTRKYAFWLARKVWGPGILRIAGAELEVRGLERVDFSRPQVFLMNHESLIDIPAAFSALPVPLHFIAKKELRLVPFLGWYMWAMGMIFIDRKNTSKALESLERSARLIQKGKCVLGFPEGTRSRNGQIAKFKKGIFGTAIEAGVPVVPMAIEGAAEVLPPKTLRFRPGRIVIEIGTPLSTQALGAKERERLAQRVQEAVVELHQKIMV